MKRITLLLPALSLALVAQEAPSKDEEDLLALLNTPITVASKKAMTTRESPGVITLITREELQALGARDMIDILRLVPGFEIGYDVQGVTGPAMRGIWGYEGKILVLWDGLELNESMYGDVFFGSHYPVDQIKRVEIIRGPGSSIYGGYAEVAVIQITSLGADDVKGVGAGFTYGKGREATYRQTAEVVGGFAGQDLKLSFGGFMGTGVRSEGTFTDPTGTSFSLKDTNKFRPAFANLGLTTGGFQFRALLDQYVLDQQDNISTATPAPSKIRFGSTNLDARYTFEPVKGLSLTPFLTWRDQKPWWVDDPSAGVFMYQANRTRAGLGMGWDMTSAVNLAAGLEWQKDSADVQAGSANIFPAGDTSVSYTSKALYGQLQYQGPVNLTVGARWEDHSAAGSAFVPRAALTKVFGKWHVKLLYAHAFRTPAIANLNPPNPANPIEPEKTRTAEVEVGVQTGASLFTLNLFDTVIKKPLVYTVTVSSSGYFNQSQTGTRGFELEWKLRKGWGFLNATFSHHEAHNEVDAWSVPGHDKNFLGFAPQKATLATGLKLGGGFTLGGSLIWLSERYAYQYDPGSASFVLGKLGSDLLVGLNLSFTREAFTASLGVQDTTDRKVPFVQPYFTDPAAAHGSLPGPGREVVAKLRYGF